MVTGRTARPSVAGRPGKRSSRVPPTGTGRLWGGRTEYTSRGRAAHRRRHLQARHVVARKQDSLPAWVPSEASNHRLISPLVPGRDRRTALPGRHARRADGVVTLSLFGRRFEADGLRHRAVVALVILAVTPRVSAVWQKTVYVIPVLAALLCLAAGISVDGRSTRRNLDKGRRILMPDRGGSCMAPAVRRAFSGLPAFSYFRLMPPSASPPLSGPGRRTAIRGPGAAGRMPVHVRGMVA